MHKGALAAHGKLDDLRRNVSGSATLEEVFFAVAGGAPDEGKIAAPSASAAQSEAGGSKEGP